MPKADTVHRLSRIGPFLPWILIAAWIVIQAVSSLPGDIAEDWNGWRQCDTQSIAENFVRWPSGILHPRVNWGGDGPGFVEAEVQIYTYACALAMRLVGIGPRPGQWISLLAIAGAAAELFSCLRRRFGPVPGLFGMTALLLTRAAIFTSTAVQPDALAFLFATLSFTAFVGYLDEGRRGALVRAGGFLLLAAWIKPTHLYLGIFQFLALLLLRRDLLRRGGIWLAWAVVLAGMALFFWHGARIYAEYGNTFGVGFGGDSKLPNWSTLVSPSSYPPWIRMSAAWGLGLPGILAAIYLVARRRLDRVAVALGIANVVMLLVAFRYTSNEWYGPHYHLATSLLTGWLVALAARDLEQWIGRAGLRNAALAGLAVLVLFSGFRELDFRRSDAIVLPDQLDSVNAGRALGELVQPGDLVILRASAKARSEQYDTENNYQDPIVFQVAEVRGWILPADEDQLPQMIAAADRGARFYVDVYGRERSAETEAWLAGNAELVSRIGERVRIYALHAGGDPAHAN